ncbi:MAG TPA: CsgG/HfaB family protein [Gemmatimonadales bacterium]|jgi:TolB-like protein|nr:CsgG/HfaB family protein [Gemmatimonadales bacterium]
MTRQVWLTLATALTTLASSAAAQDTRPGIAVLPFENGGSYGQDKENFEALQKGIPAMLLSELSKNPAARLVDRSQTQEILKEQDLGKDGRVDANTAAKVGKIVGARYVIMGSFIDFYGKFRVDARIVNVETSEIMKVVTNDPSLQKREDLFKIIQSVSDKIMADTKLPPLPTDVAKAAKSRVVPTEALTYYSRALLYQDRGDNAKAAEYYKRAISVFPDYAEAQEGLKKVSPA